ncbi:MAG: hypothetical protein IJQ32_03805 [Paludibacteraceae bacterium]|nr:hypothetical protein [Paludibacteraceae bacterium]
MRKLRPWVIGFGILAVVAVIAANIFDTMLGKEDMKDEPAWVEPDSIAGELRVEQIVND